MDDIIEFIANHFLLFIIAFFLLIAGVLVFSWVQESDTYNRLTGAHTTWRDAMFVELRVQGVAK